MLIELLVALGLSYWLKSKWSKKKETPDALAVFGANPIMDSERIEMFAFYSLDKDQLNYYNLNLCKVNQSEAWSLVKHEYKIAFGQPCETIAVFEMNESVWDKPDRIGFDDLGRILYYARDVTPENFNRYKNQNNFK